MTMTRALAALSVLAAAGGAATIAVQGRRSFLPYLFVLLVAAPLGALAAGLATGGVRSNEHENPPPNEDGRGSFVVLAFRSYRALRDAAAAALGVFALVGGIAFVDYFGSVRRPAGMAVLALLAWMALLARLGWAVLKRTWVSRHMDEARLSIRPRYPMAGTTLHVAFEQPVRTDLWVRAVDLTLVAERLTVRLVNRRTRAKTVRVCRERLRLSVEGRAWPGTPIHVEGVFQVPPSATEEGGFLSWHVEARSRVLGPDYVTRFPIRSV